MPTALTNQISSSIAIVDDPDDYDAAVGVLGASVYHQPAWRSCMNVYGLKVHWLTAQRAGKPVGVLPLVQQSSLLFGRRIISLPWVDEAGAVGEPQAVAALLDKAAELTSGSGPHTTAIIKQAANADTEGLGDWYTSAGNKVLMRRRLGMPAHELWDKLSAKVRNQVRKAQKKGLVTEQVGLAGVDDFYRVYAQNMRDLGSPSHSRTFFFTLVEALGDRANVYRTVVDDRVVGGGIVLKNGDSLDIPWASSLREFNSYCVNHGMYWQMLADGCEAGFSWFRFGRSTVNSGQHRFKKQWGADEQPLAWLEYAPDGTRQENACDSATNQREKFGWAERIWTRLPVWLSRQLGPRIIRHLP